MKKKFSAFRHHLSQFLSNDWNLASLLTFIAALVRYPLYLYLIDVNWANKDAYCRAYMSKQWWLTVDLFPPGAWPPLPFVFNIAFLPFAKGDFLVSSTYAVIFFGSASIGILYLLSRTFASRVPSVAMAFIAIALWPHIFISVNPLSEAIALAFMLAGCLFFIRNNLNYSGLFFALACLCRIEAVAILGFLYFWLVLEGYRTKIYSDLIHFLKWSLWGCIILAIFWIQSGGLMSLFSHHFALIEAEQQFMDMSVKAIVESLRSYPHFYAVIVLTLSTGFLFFSDLSGRTRVVCFSFLLLIFSKFIAVINQIMLAEPRYFVICLTALLPFSIYTLYRKFNRAVFIGIVLALVFYNAKSTRTITNFLLTKPYSHSIQSLVDYLRSHEKWSPVVVFDDGISYNQCYVFLKSGLPYQRLITAPNYHQRFRTDFPETKEALEEYLLSVRPNLFIYPNNKSHYQLLFNAQLESQSPADTLETKLVWTSQEYSVVEIKYRQ